VALERRLKKPLQQQKGRAQNSSKVFLVPPQKPAFAQTQTNAGRAAFLSPPEAVS
jgi:hypothetical protein